jgi:hypothetical protein
MPRIGGWDLSLAAMPDAMRPPAEWACQNE